MCFGQLLVPYSCPALLCSHCTCLFFNLEQTNDDDDDAGDELLNGPQWQAFSGVAKGLKF